MNILHITPSYKPAVVYGGPTVSVSQLCEWQVKIGHRVSVYTTTANGAVELEVPPNQTQQVDGVAVTYFPRITKDHTHLSPALLWQIWKKARDFDVVHIHSWWNLVAVLGAWVCLLRGVRPVLSPRGMLGAYSFQHENSRKKAWIHRLMGKALLTKTVLHATAPLEVRDAQQIIPAWPHFVAPNIIVLPKLPEVATTQPAGPFRLVFLSRIDPKKGLELTFEALAQVQFPFVFHIYGEAEAQYLQALKSMAEKLGIGQYIKWQGWANGEAKFKALAEAELFVLTSHNENFANAVLEALACGTPVLVSDQVGLADYVGSQEDLGWVTSLQTSRIAERLTEAYRQRHHTHQNAELIAQTVIRDFQPKQVAARYVDHYRTFGA